MCVEEVVKNKESAIVKAGQLIANTGNTDALVEYIRSLESIWNNLPRAKTAKLIRSLMDLFENIKEGLSDGEQKKTVKQMEMRLCMDLVEWTIRDKRAFLKQTLELRLASLYLDNQMYTDALALVSQLLRELKRMDDKLTLVAVHLLECRIYFQLRNGPKAKAALTAARSNANSIYCPPLTQAALDMQSALIHADDGDFKTAYSYFMEALDSYVSQNDQRGAKALKYMMLCKIMMGGHHIDELDALLNGKLGSKYSLDSKEVMAMKAVAEAHKSKSLKQFEGALSMYPVELGTDPMIHAHFQSLYDQLLQQNLLRIVRPYSRVQLDHIASAIELPLAVVEGKLSMMILDGQLKAIINQHEQCLVLREEPVCDGTFALAIETVRHLDSVVDALYQKATFIN